MVYVKIANVHVHFDSSCTHVHTHTQPSEEDTERAVEVLVTENLHKIIKNEERRKVITMTTQ